MENLNIVAESSEFSGLILSKSLPHSPAICGMAAQPSSHLDSEGHPAGVGPVSFQWAFNGRRSASCRLEMPVSPVPIRKRLGGSACPAWCGYEKIWLVDGCRWFNPILWSSGGISTKNLPRVSLVVFSNTPEPGRVTGTEPSAMTCCGLRDLAVPARLGSDLLQDEFIIMSMNSHYFHRDVRAKSQSR